MEFGSGEGSSISTVAMDGHLTQSLKISAVVHVIVLALVLVCPLVFRGLHKTSSSIPVEFTVAVPRAPLEQWVKPSAPAPVAAQIEPDEVVVQRETGPSKTRPKSVRQEPLVSHKANRVTRYEPVRSTSRVQSAKPLSQREISELLARGAKPGAETVIPDAEARFLETIRSTLYNAWLQPSAEEARDSVVEVEIRFGADGVVTGWRVVRKSGIPAMDASVARALQNVKRIQGLTPSFIGRHETVTIAFRVEQ
jgi:TonB family protein